MLTPNRYPKVLAPDGSQLAPDGSPIGSDASQPQRVKPYNEALHKRFKTYQTESGLSQTELASQLGVSSTAVSRYLSGKPEGDVEYLETLIEDLLKAAARRNTLDGRATHKNWKTPLAITINGYIQNLRKTNSVGLLSGPAGIGKSCGVELYIENNPTSVLITCSIWCRTPKELEAALFDSIEHRRWKAGTRYSTLLIDRFKNSNRTLVLDNAHRLRRAALAYIFDFHDSTRIPICFVGNPEILDTISLSDQHFSRVGPHKKLTHPKDSSENLVTRTLLDRWPEASNSEPLFPLCVRVLESEGHFRSLRQQVDFAKELSTHPSFIKDFEKKTFTADLHESAFRAAHERLIRNYKL